MISLIILLEICLFLLFLPVDGITIQIVLGNIFYNWHIVYHLWLDDYIVACICLVY